MRHYLNPGDEVQGPCNLTIAKEPGRMIYGGMADVGDFTHFDGDGDHVIEYDYGKDQWYWEDWEDWEDEDSEEEE